MEFRQLLKIRRSVRKFKDTPVPRELLDEVIAHATLAPNAGNRQPWTFIVIQDPALMKQLSDDSKASILDDIKADPGSSLKVYESHMKNPDFNVFYNAPCLIYIAGRADIPTIAKDCALAASYLMLSAASQGLGSCWIELGRFIRDPDLIRGIRLPEGAEIHAPLVLGYPAIIPTIPKRNPPDIINISWKRNQHGDLQRTH